MTVVECGNAASPAGFKLVDIVETSLTGTSGTDASISGNGFPALPLVWVGDRSVKVRRTGAQAVTWKGPFSLAKIALRMSEGIPDNTRIGYVRPGCRARLVARVGFMD